MCREIVRHKRRMKIRDTLISLSYAGFNPYTLCNVLSAELKLTMCLDLEELIENKSSELVVYYSLLNPARYEDILNIIRYNSTI